MRKHKLGQQGRGLLALDVVDGLHEETLYKDGRPEAMRCPPGGRNGRDASVRTCFLRCSMTVFDAGSGLEAASSKQPANKQRAGITFAVELGR